MSLNVTITPNPANVARANKKKKAIVLMSGGLKSAIMIQNLINADYDPRGVFFDYGQRAAKQEEAAAVAQAGFFGINLNIFDISTVAQMRPTRPYTIIDKSIPIETVSPDVRGIIPIMAMFAVQQALDDRADRICIGWRVEDKLWLEADRLSVNAIQNMILNSSSANIQVECPWLFAKPGEHIKQMLKTPGAERILQITWSCLDGMKQPCTVCKACKLRVEAFVPAGTKDQPFKLPQKPKVEPEKAPAALPSTPAGHTKTAAPEPEDEVIEADYTAPPMPAEASLDDFGDAEVTAGLTAEASKPVEKKPKPVKAKPVVAKK